MQRRKAVGNGKALQKRIGAEPAPGGVEPAAAGHIEALASDRTAERFDLFARIRHRPFPGGAWLRTPLLVLAMAWYRLRDRLG